MGFSLRTASWPTLSFVDAPDPLAEHTYLLHTLHVSVGTSGLAFMRNVPLPSSHYFHALSSSLSNLMRREPIDLPAQS